MSRVSPRSLRQTMTPEERHLWYDFLRQLPVTVRRQKPLGRYVVDFYIASAPLVIEVDGGQHYHGEGRAQDLARDAYLQGRGLHVLRYSNREVSQNFQAVCQDIVHHMDRFSEETSKKNG